MPSDRMWTVSTTTDPDPETGELNRDKVIESLHDIESIGHREGGLFVVTPIRKPRSVPVYRDGEYIGDQEIEGEFETVGWRFDHKSAPAARVVPQNGQREEPPVEPEPEVEPEQQEPVAAE